MILSDFLMIIAIGGFIAFWLWNKNYKITLYIALFSLTMGAISLYQLHWQAVVGVIVSILCLITLLLSRSPKESSRKKVLMIIGLVGIGAAAAPYYFFPIFTLPEPDGKYAVGTQSFETKDESRLGVLAEEKTIARRVKIKVWYPAKPSPHSVKATYWDSEGFWEKSVSLAQNFGFSSFIYTHLNSVQTNSKKNAAIAQTTELFPLIVFSHGFWSYLEQNTALMEKLASHGYVVISMSHVRDSATVTFADGSSVAPYFYDENNPHHNALDQALDKSLRAFMGSPTHELRTSAIPAFEKATKQHRIYESFLNWRDDMLFAVKEFQSGHIPDLLKTIRERTDFNTIGTVGMSFGGTMAATYCHIENRCIAAVNLDGENFDFDLYNTNINSSLLLLLTDQPFNSYQISPDTGVNPTDYAYEPWQLVGDRRDVYRMRLHGIKHLGLTDLHLSARSPFRDNMYGKIGRIRGIDATNDLILAYLDKHIRGIDNGFPETLLTMYPEIHGHDPKSLRDWAKKTNTTE